ncbi:MAG: hypothetical protein ACYDHZ_07960 [Dehalococcoidia bacterium]
MIGKIGGQRPRPRVALLGKFESDELEYYNRLFPTIWTAADISDLGQLVDQREIDLLIVAPEVTRLWGWADSMHVICFSAHVEQLPGPVKDTIIEKCGNAETEEFYLPELPLAIHYCREATFSELSDVRGCLLLRARCSGRYAAELEQKAEDLIEQGAIICERATKGKLAVAYLRDKTNLGIAWLPNVDKNRTGWVNSLITQWAIEDKERLGGFSDWHKSPQWLVAIEQQLVSQIESLEKEKNDFIIETNKKIAELSDELALTNVSVNAGLRRLVTAQGPELVDEVAKVFKQLGFIVTNTDSVIGENQPKREDLRLETMVDPFSKKKQWTAIVEVRGYAKSGGMTSDIGRLGRFAELYHREIGNFPDKRIYIVNNQLELLPSQRRPPLEAAPDDLAVFADNNGILIWTVDLFKAMRSPGPSDYFNISQSIKNASGRWFPPNSSSSKDAQPNI